ncbi:hypothetical protein AJ78_00959 [Emergomyces pasteurianus Ep9510]|uniref:Nephrocystin 3-like N-terminal domain-containing protein n=1 Tax=Emergomyces pasteurianus Ep9510 TaxID=1447872 RepID=A0A1J9PS73_9EURO|nr:hypothetical protein AJ78_00959 [Emergomyces pasteurianus Ep9510]
MEKRQKKHRRFLCCCSTSRDPSPSPPARPSGSTTVVDPAVGKTPSLPISPNPPPPDPPLNGAKGVLVVVDGQKNTPKPNPALKLAIENHIKGLSPSEQEAFRKGASKDDLLARAADLDAQHKESSSFRHHTEKITRVLKFFDQFMAGVTIAIQANPDISSIVVGGVRLVLDIAMRFSEYFDRLTDMISRLTDYLQALEIRGRSEDVRIINATAATYGELLKFCQKANSVFLSDAGGRKSTINIFFNQLWQPFQAVFGEIDSNIQHHLKVVEITANAIQLDWLQNREKSEDKSNFLAWLSGAGVDFDKRHHDIFSKKHPGTADWFLNGKQFKSWVDSPKSSLLWCYGKVGAGKSVLASNVVEHFFGKHLFDETVGVSYIYYHYGDASLQDLSLVVAGTLLPICRKLDEIPDWLNKYKNDGFSPSSVCRTEMFCKVIAQKLDQIILIVDALDECPKKERCQFIRFLDAVLKIPKTKILVTSRKEDNILHSFNDFNNVEVTKIEIQADDIRGDVKTFVAENVRLLRKGSYGKKLHIGDDSLEGVIIHSLTNKFDGMFLWVYLQLEHLCRVSEARQDWRIREELDRLPSGLDETYMRIVHDICSQLEYEKHIALNALMWVLHAKRPLSKKELRYAVTLSSDPDTDQENLNLVDFDFLLGSCKNLVVYEGGFIQLVHYSAKKFMTCTNFGGMKLQLSAIQAAHIANERLVSSCLSCLRHLLRVGLLTSRKEYKELLEFLDDHPCVLYAAWYFDAHIYDYLHGNASITERCLDGIKAVIENSEILTVLRLRLVQPPYPSLQTWRAIKVSVKRMDPKKVIYSTSLIQVQHIREKYASGEPPADALHLVAANGDQDTAIRLIGDGYDINKLNEDGACALYYPCESGHLPMVSLLIERGANVNVACGFYGSPLQAASARGHEAIVRMLLDNGACNDIRSKTGPYHTALDASIQQQNRKIAHLLIDHEIDINARCGRHGTALQVAVAEADHGLVNLLLGKGADVNANVGMFGTPLKIASARADKEMVKLLLDKGANISQGNALQAAAGSSGGTAEVMEVVKLLIEKGAEVNAREGKSDPALAVAASNGRISIVGLLLDKGADIHQEEVLKCAANTSRAMIELLLEKGAGVNAKGESTLEEALSTAVFYHNTNIVKLLLDKGADIHALSDSVLERLISAGNRALVELLVNRGANVNEHGGILGPPLFVASMFDRYDIAEFLLDNGADVNYQKDGGESALEEAFIRGHHLMVGLLLKKGALDIRGRLVRKYLYQDRSMYSR